MILGQLRIGARSTTYAALAKGPALSMACVLWLGIRSWVLILKMSVGVQEVAWKYGWFLFPYRDIETGECGVVKTQAT